MPLQFTPATRHGGILNFAANARGVLTFSANSRAVLSSLGLQEANQAEAEAGLILGKYMSPLRVAQAIDALGSGMDIFTQDGSGASDRTYLAKVRELGVSITDFGAVGDNTTTNAAANYNAFVNALATGRPVFVPYHALGYNIGTNRIDLTSGDIIVGENRQTTIFGTGSAIFGISSLGPETRIENLTLYGANGSGTTGVLLLNGSAQVNQVTLRHLSGLYLTHMVDDEGSSNSVGYLTLEDIYVTQTYGLQFRSRNSSGFIRIRDVNIDFTNEVGIGLVSWGALEFSNFEGIILDGWNVATGYGTGTPTYDSSVTAFKFDAGAVVVCNGNLYADSTIGDGVLINAASYVWGGSYEGSQNLGRQVYLTSCSDIQAEFIAYGASGVTGASSSKHGVELSSCVRGTVNIYARNCTGDGAAFTGTTNQITVTALNSTGNTGNWASISDTANTITFEGGTNTGNGGGLSSAGAGKITVQNVPGISDLRSFNTTAGPSLLSSATMCQQVQADATTNRSEWWAFGAGTELTGLRANNTNLSPTALTTDESIIGLHALGWHSGGALSGDRAAITLRAAEAWSGSAQGTLISFYVTPTGSTTEAETGRFAATLGELDLGKSATTAGTLGLYGGTSGLLKLKSAATAGSNTITLPAGTTDFSATGGSGQVVKQTSAGGAFTVATVAASEIASGAALTRTDDTNVTLTLGGSPTVALLAATSLTLGWTGQLALSRGGTNASLTASTGGIVYSGASALAILSGTATARQMLQSGASAAPAWSTTTWPATTSVDRILYSSSANVVGEITTANNGVLITSSGGTPSISTTIPSATQDNITRTGTLVAGATGAGFTVALGTSTITGDLAFANLTQGSARSVLAVAGNATADFASLQSSAGGQILNSTATAIAWTATPTLGIAGTTVGDLSFANATSGTITLRPTTGALGSAVLTMPAATDTIAVLAASQALTGKTYNGLTITTTTGTLTVTNGKTVSVSNTLTFTGTDSSSVAFGGGGTVAYTANKLSAFAATSSSELAGVISDETGSGALVFGTSPAFTTGLTVAGTNTTIKAADWGGSNSYVALSLNNDVTSTGMKGFFASTTTDTNNFYIASNSAIRFRINNSDVCAVLSTTFAPASDGGAYFGATNLRWAGGSFYPFTVGSPPPSPQTGQMAYFSDLRVFNGAGTRQGAGAGTGGFGVYNGTNWVNFDAQSVTIAA